MDAIDPAPPPPVPVPDEAQRAEAAQQGMGLALWARYQPDAPAVASSAGDRSFGQLNAAANRLARALRARGLTAGDAVALVCSNRPEFAEVVYACMRAGLRYTPINRHLTAEEVAYIVGDCGARALIGDARFGDMLADAAQRSPGASVRLAIGGDIAGYDSYDGALAAQDGADLDDPELGTRMLYTSGTTGRPKGVVRPAIYATRMVATTSAARYVPGTGQQHLCTGPLYHGGPLSFSLLLPLAAGVGTRLMDRFDAADALRMIAAHRITHTHMVPTMFHRMLRLPADVRASTDVSSVQYILHGAAPCPVATKKAMMQWFGPIIWEYFAATEGTGASVGPEQWLARPGTVGRPPTDDHVRIVDDEGNPCPVNVPGTIHLKAMVGADFEYFNDPDKTAAARRGSHFTLGDVGYLDEDGFLFLTDRSTELIISGGVNIYPAEVEATLLQHPVVRDVAVIGVPNEEWGEEVRGIVECAQPPEDAAALCAELVAFCRERLSHFKCPRRVDLVDHLPRDDNGKLYKGKLRDAYRSAGDGR